jgi:photoactive yellow protein
MVATSLADVSAMAAFDAPDLASLLERSSDAELDDAPFGVVRLDGDHRVTLYNRWESQLAGLSPERVLGKVFFTEVAPCTNNYLVALRYEQDVLDETIDYVFSYRLKPTKVRLRLLKTQPHCSWLLVVLRGDG